VDMLAMLSNVFVDGCEMFGMMRSGEFETI
jgi:hypothetical protein